jgi:N6-L-threonylcarbamoyladenine synthase
MYILGIETSCDETAAAVLDAQSGRFLLRSSVVSSQIAIHRRFGGVVPEVAARNHITKIIPVIDEALAQAKVTPKQIDRIAVTIGPGLVTALHMGIETARGLAVAWNKPVVPVNHMRGHLYAGLLVDANIKYPAVTLIVSGGHTELVVLTSATKVKKIGATVDDAAGEAFDKVAHLLDLPYPGGPQISKLAEHGDTTRFAFPRPMLRTNDFAFSFSGLKTAVRNEHQKIKNVQPGTKADISASFQQAVIDVLLAKTLRAAKQYKAKTVMLSGGVAANTALRIQLAAALAATKPAPKFVVPPIQFCTDNGAMIALAGYFAKPTPWHKLTVDPNADI